MDIGPVVGKLARNEVDEERLDGVMVQVQRSSITTERPLLSTRISIPSEYAVLIPERKIKVSLKISNMQKRTTLIELGKKLAPSDWGILWRTRAAKQPARVLESEIFHLSETWKLILKRAKEEKAPALLWGNKYYTNVEFPALSKLRLDEMRTQITPTINGHHYYKACGKVVSAALETAERMLESDATREDVERLFQKTIEPEYPVEGSLISVEHEA